MPNQQGAPVPQDVHPQQYQAAGVGAPPGPQWGVPGPGSMPQGPGPAPTAHDGSRRLAEIQKPPPPPPNPYDQREPMRAPLPQRPLSPRQEQMRQYQEQHRHTPVRRPSPPPNVNHMGSNPYPGQQGLPQPLAPPASQPSAPNRITNPNYGVSGAGVGPPPSVVHGAPGPVPPYVRGNSPPPEIRPIAEDRAPSPGSSYPHPHPHHYHPAPPSQPGGIAAGAPPPVAALAAAEAAARVEREERPPNRFKHMLDSEDDYKGMHKVPANGETRARFENPHYQRPSSPERKPSPRQRQNSPRRQPSPPIGHRRSSSEVRHEDQRRADENYHPSEAAHHPPTLPSMHQQPPQHQQQEHLPPINDTGREERSREAYEPAIRKVDVDEDYDDEGDDEKRPGGSGGRNSPQRGMMNGQTKIEAAA